METNRAQHLPQWLLGTLSPDPMLRRAAEESLSDAAGLPGYGLSVLRVVAESSDDTILHAASAAFKNHLRSRWLSDGNSGISPIADSEKEKIKTLIVFLMNSSLPPRIQSQLSEALIVIGKKDFLKSWPTFLPRLISQLQVAAFSRDYASLNGILGTANSIFQKFRQKNMTDDQLLDLQYCLDMFCCSDQFLLGIFKKTHGLIEIDANPKSLFESQTLCCSIFLSFSFEYLPQFFKVHMNDLMKMFIMYLSPSPILETTTVVDVVDDLRSAVLANINLYMEKYENDFERFVNGFAGTIYTLLQGVSTSPSREQLATAAMKFFTTVSTSGHHDLFAGDNVIKNFCLRIVIPNVFLRVEEEELFEMNYVEFIRRDMEASGLDTRRRMACELLKGLATNYKTQVVGVLISELQKLYRSFSENPAMLWRNQACVIDVVISLGDCFQLIYQNIILSELRSSEDSSSPMLQAWSLKFLAMFSGHIRKPVGIELLRELARLLKANSKVVQSYAACCIEKLLLVKEEDGKSRYVAGDINVFSILRNLFDALKLVKSEENHYVMKCIMRVLGVAEISGEAAEGLTSILNEQGFYLLHTVFKELRPSTTDMEHVWRVLFELHSIDKTSEFKKYLLKFMSIVVVVRGCSYVEESINAIRPNLFAEVLDGFWIPGLKLIRDWRSKEMKLAAVAATTVMCELNCLLRWGKMFDSILTLVLRPDQGQPEMPEISEDVLHTAGFEDPKKFLVYKVANLSHAHPGVLGQIIAGNLEQDNQVAWIQLCTDYEYVIA